ncbi:MAG: SIS domain-containing protein [Alphaproteobacteria bacterium]|nr:SIS domain-containing protein [Alphaproteobacteria bacterium]
MPSFSSYLHNSLAVLQLTLDDQSLAVNMEHAIHATEAALSKGQPLLVCGNGGSASDAQHIAGELVGRFLIERKALNVICLSDNAAVLTALANDYGYETVFSRQVEAYGQGGGVLLGLSTSGNSANVIQAFIKAKEYNMTTIALTGKGGGKLANYADILLEAPSNATPLIQQIHLMIYHYFCQEVEKRCANSW